MLQRFLDCFRSDDYFLGLLDSSEVRDIRRAGNVLVSRRVKSAVPQLRALMKHRDPMIRALVAGDLGLLGGEEELALLGSALRDEDAFVRTRASQGIGFLACCETGLRTQYSTTAIHLLNGVQNDPDEGVRIAAKFAIRDVRELTISG